MKELNEVASLRLKKYKPEFDEKGKIISVRVKNKTKQYEKNLTEDTVKKFDYILSSISCGNSRKDTINAFMNDNNCNYFTANNWYTSALKYLKELNSNERDYVKEKYEIMLMNLFQQALEFGDRNEAHKLLQTLIKLNGVNETEKREIKNSFEFKFNTPNTKQDNISLNINSQDINFEEINDDEENEEDDE